MLLAIEPWVGAACLLALAPVAQATPKDTLTVALALEICRWYGGRVLAPVS